MIAKGETSLHRATVNGHKATVRQLMGKETNIKEEDENVRTALIRAIHNGHMATMRLEMKICGILTFLRRDKQLIKSLDGVR
jgi:ankyrin repeat protein